jgi:hypothetical protein
MAVSFVLLAVDVTVESAGDLTGGQHPATSWVGIGLSAVALVAMPPLALAKWRVSRCVAHTCPRRCGRFVGERRRRLVVGGPARRAGVGAVACGEARDVWRGESCGCC